MEKLCEAVHISLNKNAVHGDQSAAVPGGVRLGTPAMTTRGLTTRDFEEVAAFLDEAAQLAQSIQKRSGPKLVGFVDEMTADPKVEELRSRVQAFATGFDMP